MSAVALTYSAQGKVNYRQNADRQLRDTRVLEHAGMVRRVALHLADRLDGSVDADDLIQTGLVGLLEAAERYSPMENIPFEAYALPRIRGAMMDSLRRTDWCSRSARKQGREIRAARTELQQQLGREPSDTELAEAAGVSLSEFHQVMSALDNAGIASVDLMMESGEQALPKERDKAMLPVVNQRQQQALVEALKQLPEREQLIMNLYYDQELNQKEIAKVVGLTEARVSQLRSKAVKSLQRRLSEWK